MKIYEDNETGVIEWAQDNLDFQVIAAIPDPQAERVWLAVGVATDMVVEGNEVAVLIYLPGSALGGERGDAEEVDYEDFADFAESGVFA